MRWIDISVPPPSRCQPFDTLVHEARELGAGMEEIQQREGLDGLQVTRAMGEVGRLLFRAIQASDPAAFCPRAEQSGAETPPLGPVESDALIGYHLHVPPELVDLPWNWLHSGLGFVIETHPLCVGTHGSRIPEALQPRPWMQRYSEALFQRWTGETVLGAPLDGRRATPEILFVPGHGDEAIRQLIYREADGIRDALLAPRGAPATLLVPRYAITPQQLAVLSLNFQAIHYAGPTSMPGDTNVTDVAWLTELEAAAGAAEDAEVEDMVGLEADVVGVDPVDALLDSVVERYVSAGTPPEPITALAGQDGAERPDEGNLAEAGPREPGRRSTRRRAPGSEAAIPSGSWLLDDGPVRPEILGQLGSVPPLVFSNSHRSLPELGSRFLSAGASTFVGPLVPLYSRPARHFAAHFYSFLSDGLCAAAAQRAAALALREELGPDHPAWLSYGVSGYGALALQYL